MSFAKGPSPSRAAHLEVQMDMLAAAIQMYRDAGTTGSLSRSQPCDRTAFRSTTSILLRSTQFGEGREDPVKKKVRVESESVRANYTAGTVLGSRDDHRKEQ